MEHSKALDTVAASLEANRGHSDRVKAGGVFTVTCVGPDGQTKWEDTFHNLVTNVGLVDMNTKYFTGSAYTATWFLGLITGPGSGTTIAAGDTLASHAGWAEFTNYAGSRKTCTFGTATTADPSVITNSASVAAFSISGAGGLVAGAFLASVATGTSGILFSASDFAAPGDRAVVSGDTLNITYTFSLDAA